MLVASSRGVFDDCRGRAEYFGGTSNEILDMLRCHEGVMVDEDCRSLGFGKGKKRGRKREKRFNLKLPLVAKAREVYNPNPRRCFKPLFSLDRNLVISATTVGTRHDNMDLRFCSLARPCSAIIRQKPSDHSRSYHTSSDSFHCGQG
jgi:hypothetical protein